MRFILSIVFLGVISAGLTGGWSTILVNDQLSADQVESVEKLKQFILENQTKIEDKCQSQFEDIQIVAISQQVVNGIKKRIQFSAGDTKFEISVWFHPIQNNGSTQEPDLLGCRVIDENL